jgi:MFS family permease
LALLGGVSNGNAWGWSSPLTIGSIVLGFALLIVWVLVERKVTFPLVDLNLILRGGIGLPIVVAFLFGAQLFGSQTPSALFLRADPATLNYGLGMTSSAAGLVLAIFAFTAFLGATVSDRVARWFGGPKAIMAAGFLGALAYVLMIFAPGNALTFTLWLSLSGFSGGVIIGALPTIVVNRAPADSVGIASAVYNTARTAAGAAAGAVFALVMSSLMTNSTTGGTTAPVSSHLSYQAVWGICAGISVVLAVLAGRMGQPQANPQDAAEADASLDGGDVEKEKESAAN